MSAMERGDGVEKPKRTLIQFFVLKSETEIQEMTHLPIVGDVLKNGNWELG